MNELAIKISKDKVDAFEAMLVEVQNNYKITCAYVEEVNDGAWYYLKANEIKSFWELGVLWGLKLEHIINKNSR